jgi:hypothetical protein
MQWTTQPNPCSFDRKFQAFAAAAAVLDAFAGRGRKVAALLPPGPQPITSAS